MMKDHLELIEGGGLLSFFGASLVLWVTFYKNCCKRSLFTAICLSLLTLWLAFGICDVFLRIPTLYFCSVFIVSLFPAIF